jgi:hypothetical protein
MDYVKFKELALLLQIREKNDTNLEGKKEIM